MSIHDHPPILREVPGADTALLMIHGIFGSPNQFADMGEYFYEKGYTTQTILLPGHGGTTKDFADSRAYMWRAFVKVTIQKLKQSYKNVVLMGHSMGGLLSIETVTELDCQALVLIGTPTSISPKLTGSKLRRQILSGEAQDNPELEDYMKAYSVDAPKLWESLSWTIPLLDLTEMCRDISEFFPNIHVPVFICQSVGDETIGGSSAEELAIGLNHTIVEMTLLKESNHSHFIAEERTLLISKIEDFLRRHI